MVCGHTLQPYSVFRNLYDARIGFFVIEIKNQGTDIAGKNQAVVRYDKNLVPCDGNFHCFNKFSKNFL